MDAKINQPKTLQDAIAYFADPDDCFRYACKLRWPSGEVSCPRCGGQKFSFIKTRRIWFCYDCKKQFTVKVKTIMEDSALGLDKWMTAIWMLANCRNGVSSHELARTLGITQKSAWFMLQRIREALSEQKFGRGKVGAPGNQVEADECFIGGKVSNMHAKRRMRSEQRGPLMNKTVVHGRTATGLERFATAMSGLAGKRLTYSDLTGKSASPHHETTGTGETEQVPF
jgi:transposase-like protein